MAFSSRMLSSTPSCLKPQSKLRYQPSFLGKAGHTNSTTWHQDKCLNLEDPEQTAGNYQALIDPDMKIQIVMITVTCKMGNEDSKLSCTQEFHHVNVWSALIILLTFCMLWWAKSQRLWRLEEIGHIIFFSLEKNTCVFLWSPPLFSPVEAIEWRQCGCFDCWPLNVLSFHIFHFIQELVLQQLTCVWIYCWRFFRQFFSILHLNPGFQYIR